MLLSAKVAIILEQNKPSRVTPQLRRIWPDIEAFRKAGYLYTEIVGLLRVHYGIEVSYKSFMSARRRIERPPSRQRGVGGVGKEDQDGQPDKSSPLARARQKLAEDQRTAEILAGRG